jgi:hypothetical protein
VWKIQAANVKKLTCINLKQSRKRVQPDCTGLAAGLAIAPIREKPLWVAVGTVFGTINGCNTALL